MLNLEGLGTFFGLILDPLVCIKCYSAFGIVKKNVVPFPTSLSSQILPSSFVIIPLQIDMPNYYVSQD